MTEKEFEMVKALYDSYDKTMNYWTVPFAIDAVDCILESRGIRKEEDEEFYFDSYNEISIQIGSRFLDDPYILM